MRKHHSSFSNLTEYGDENVRFHPHTHTCGIICRDRQGRWQYAGMFTNIIPVPDGRWHLILH